MFRDTDLEKQTEFRSNNIFVIGVNSGTVVPSVKTESKSFSNLGIFLGKAPVENSSYCSFICWLLDYIESNPLPLQIENLLWTDSSQSIKRISEFKKEYGKLAVVIADNYEATIFMLSSTTKNNFKVVKGNVHNHINRHCFEEDCNYQLRKYSKDVVAVLQFLETEDNFNHILIVGAKEARYEIFKNMPQAFKDICDWKSTNIALLKSFV